MGRPTFAEALERAGILAALAAFDPHVAGSPPLGLDLASSDIDILCHAPDPHAFTHALWSSFSGEADFSIRQWIGAGRPVIAGFFAHGWPFEIFGQAKPVPEQSGWRHFTVERRLLRLGGSGIRDAVMARRRAGAKTEPAFADLLRLEGDPYEALAEISRWPDEALLGLLARIDAGGLADAR